MTDKTEEMAALEKRLFKFLTEQFGGVKEQVAMVDRKLLLLEERMEDLEDKERYLKNSARFGPRVREPMSTSSSSINAGSREDSVIFPSLAG